MTIFTRTTAIAQSATTKLFHSQCSPTQCQDSDAGEVRRAGVLWSKKVRLRDSSLFGRRFWFNPNGREKYRAIQAAKLRSILHRSKGVIKGKLRKVGATNQDGGTYQFALSQNNQETGVSGYFVTDYGSTYLLRGTTKDLTLEKIDDTKTPDCGNDHVPDMAPELEGPARMSSLDRPHAAADGSVIRILVVYTTSAKTAVGSDSAMESTILNMVSYANQAYSNSGINITLQLAGINRLGQDETGMTFDEALDNLTQTSDGVWDEVHTLRTQYNADLVHIIIQNEDYCGLAWLQTTASTSFAPYGFGAVNYSCISSFAHEIGHNQGANHDVTNAGGQGVNAAAYGWRYTGTSNTVWRTIMAYAPGTRIQYFSNPSVTYDGQPTGSSSANNVAALNYTAPYIAAFKSDVSATPTPTPMGGNGSTTPNPTPTSTATPEMTATATPTPEPSHTATPTATPEPEPYLVASFRGSCSKRLKKGSFTVTVVDSESYLKASGVPVSLFRDGVLLASGTTNRRGAVTLSFKNTVSGMFSPGFDDRVNENFQKYCVKYSRRGAGRSAR